jgi:hypothetical protein
MHSAIAHTLLHWSHNIAPSIRLEDIGTFIRGVHKHDGEHCEWRLTRKMIRKGDGSSVNSYGLLEVTTMNSRDQRVYTQPRPTAAPLTFQEECTTYDE